MVTSDALLEQTDGIRSRIVMHPRLSVTEFARSAAWRKDLKKNKVMEVVDRNNQVGWLLSPEGMQALLDTIDYFETELERVQVAYICALRADDEDWMNGAALAQAAGVYLDASFDAMQVAIDGN